MRPPGHITRRWTFNHRSRATPSMSHTASSTADTTDWTPHVNPWLIAVAVMLATFLEVLDTSIANVALPQMAGSMASSLDEATWVLTSYLVSNGIVIPMTGWLGSYFGRKRFLLVCTVLFTVSSACCGMSTNMAMLILGRVIQGAAGGALLPMSQAILFESFPAAKRGMAMAVYGVGVVGAPIFGPILGGWITDNYSWRWIFYINIPIGALAVVLMHLFVEDPPYLRTAREKAVAVGIDYVGLVLITLWLGLFQIVLDRGQQDDWFNEAWICWASAISLAAFVLLVYWELRTPHPLVDLRVFGNRCFAVSTVLITVTGVMLYSNTSLLPMFLQGLLGYPSLNSGMAMGPRGVGIFVALVIVGKVSGAIDARWLVNAAWIIMAYSAWELGRINLEITAASVTWPNICQGLALGFLFVPLTTVSMADLPNEQMGNASGIFNMARNIGGGIGISMTNTLVARGMQAHQSLLVGHLSPYDPEFQQKLQAITGMLSQYCDPVTAQNQAYGLLYGTLQQQSALLAYVDTFRLLAILSLLCIPLVFLLKKAKASGGAVAMH